MKLYLLYDIVYYIFPFSLSLRDQDEEEIKINELTPFQEFQK